jgi:hypothetical protein
MPRNAALQALDEDHWPEPFGNPFVIGRPAALDIDGQDEWEKQFFSDPEFEELRYRYCGTLNMAGTLRTRLDSKFRSRFVLNFLPS